MASEATPSPKAKTTMESLNRTKTELTLHYDSVIESLKQFNRNGNKLKADAENNNMITEKTVFKVEKLTSTNTEKLPVDKPVDKEVQNDALNGSGKKGEY